MDPFTLATMAVAGAKGAMSIFGLGMQNRQMKRVTRMQQAQLRQNAEMVSMQGGFEQNRVQDQIDATLGAQVNFFAGGNLDPATGSPAVLQAQSAAQGEIDKLLIGAKAMTERANIFQKISDLESGLGDARAAHAFGVGTALLNTVSDWIGIANKAPTGAFKFDGFGGGMPGQTIGSGSFAAARRINGFNGWGV